MSDDKYEALYREAVITREARFAEARAEYASTLADIEQAFATELSEKIVGELVKRRTRLPLPPEPA